MPRHVVPFLATLLSLLPAPGAAMPRTYLAMTGGANVLTGAVGGEVVDSRTLGVFEVAIGSHLNDDLLLEGSFGVYGAQTGPIIPIFELDDLLLPESARTFRLEVNPMMVRLRYARGGMRTGYLKPELQAGVGFLSVTRWLQPVPGLPPDTASDMLFCGEAGLSALLILGKNWMASLGARFLITEPEPLVDDLDDLNSVAILFGLRFFLNSPRDEGVPPPKPPG